jgi:hypothetical protein
MSREIPTKAELEAESADERDGPIVLVPPEQIEDRAWISLRAAESFLTAVIAARSQRHSFRWNPA